MFVTALLAATLAAPVPKDKESKAYYPTVLGTKQVEELTTKSVKMDQTAEVTKVEEKDGVYTVTLAQPGKGEGSAVVCEVTGTTITILVGGTERMKVFDLGVKAGDSWTSEIEVGGRKRTTTHTVGKEEEVEVPAGKFKAIPVTQQEQGRRRGKVTQWYAPGVGVVKSESDSGATRVLKEFTPAKVKEEKKDK
jgi:hypothetical protein